MARKQDPRGSSHELTRGLTFFLGVGFLCFGLPELDGVAARVGGERGGMMRGLDPFRLAKVLVTTSQGSYRYGTAYAVTPDLLLTARHVIHGEAGNPPGVKVEIRFLVEGGPLREVRECWASAPEWDACLLKLTEARPLRSSLLWGEYQRSQRLEWESTGFPSAAMERMESGIRLDTADAHGHLGPYGGFERKQYELIITAGGPSSAEAWKGLSGGPVFAEGCLVGLIRSGPVGFDGQRLYATPVARLLDDAEFRQAVGAPKLQPVPRPFLQHNIAELPGARNPGALLNASYQVVPFHEETRQKELKSLEAWCEESAPLGVRLFTGGGGVGKTRLFIQWCKMLRDRGWHAGFLPPIEHGELEAQHLARLEELLGGNDPIFITLDGAEVRTTLSRELKHLQANMGGAPPVRVALLARQEGDWWRWLRERGELGALLKLHEPVPLTPVSVEGPLRQKVFEAARVAFAARLERQLIPTGESDLSDPLFERVLFLHMAALVVVLGQEFGTNTLVDQILEHEQLFWSGPARSGNDLEAGRYLREAQRAVAALTLKGGVADLEEAERTLAAARASDGGFLEVLRRLYPGSGREGDHNTYLRGLEPDVLGERLVERVLLESETGGDYLERVFEGAGEAAFRNGFLVLGRLSLQRETAARLWLKRLLDPDVRGRAVAALEAALALGKKSAFGQVGAVLAEGVRQQGTLELAKELEPLLPEHTVSLRDVALWSTEEQLKHLRDGNNGTRVERAGLLRNLRNWLSKRKHLRDGNDGTRAERARLLGNLGASLSEVGRREEAVEAAQEAVEHYRELARQRPEAFLPYLAGSLNNLGASLSKVGRREEAVEAAQEAVEHHRELARQRPEAFLPDLAMSLNNLGNSLSEVGRREEAVEAAQEAVEHHRELVRQRPEAFLPDLAGSLNNLGNSLSKVGRREEAVEAAQEAVEHYRELARQRPEAFLPDLAMSLNNLGNSLSEVGRREEAVEAAQEAEEHYRELARQRPEASFPPFSPA